MNYPPRKTLRLWLKMIDRHIELRQGTGAAGDLGQRINSALALDYSWRAHTLLMAKASTKDVLKNYRSAAHCVLKNLSMTYNPIDKDYAGELVSWETVRKSESVDGFHYALCARDYAAAEAIALLCCESPDDTGSKETGYYAQGLRHCLLGNFPVAVDYLKAIVGPHGEQLSHRHRSIHFLCCRTLLAILLCEETAFNEGLEQIIECYRDIAENTLIGTPDEFICDEAIALANVGLSHGLRVTFESNYLPRVLLDQTHSLFWPRLRNAVGSRT